MNAPSIFARAKPAAILCRETISYRIDIPQFTTAVLQRPGKARGEITLRIPYDGYESFTRDALEDVQQLLKKRASDAELTATIGYLGWTHYQHLDLGAEWRAGLRHDTFRLDIPIQNPDLTQPAQLYADSWVYKMVFPYQYKPPAGLAVVVKALLWDEKSLFLLNDNALADHKSIEHHLMDPTSVLILCADVQLYLPRVSNVHGPMPKLEPKLKSFRLHHPPGFLYQDIRLFTDVRNPREHPLVYDPEKKGVEWKEICLRPRRDPQNSGSERRLFATPTMQLHFHHPEELLSQSKWYGTIDIKIPTILLSGVDICYFDATGTLIPEMNIKKSTDIHIDLAIDLPACMENRPYVAIRRLEFPGLTLNEDLVGELKSMLIDLEFALEGEPAISKDNAQAPTCLLKASRTSDPNPLFIQVLAVGDTTITRRETAIPGGQRYTTAVRRGTTRITLWAKQKKNHHTLAQALNQLQVTLEERMRHTSALI